MLLSAREDDGTMEHVLVTWSLDSLVVPVPAAPTPCGMAAWTPAPSLPGAPGLLNLYLLVSQQLLLPSTSSWGLGVGVGVGRIRARWMPQGASRSLQEPP